MRHHLLLLCFASLFVASTAAAQVLVPLPFTVEAQTLTFHAYSSCQDPQQTTGGASVSLPFSALCSSPDQSVSTSGTFTSSNADGRLVLSLTGTIAGTCSPVGCTEVSVAGDYEADVEIRVNVPSSSLPGPALPATLVILRITSAPISSGLAGSEASVGFGRLADSTIAGENYYSEDVHDLKRTQGVAEVEETRQVTQMHLIPGDVVTFPIRTRMLVSPFANVPAVSFNETATFELQYVPEPSSSSMLAPGAALLALLGRQRGQ